MDAYELSQQRKRNICKQTVPAKRLINMSADEKLKRKVWTVMETKGLLQCYKARKDEFRHSRKKRKAYAHVLEDMLAQGFTDSSTTTVALESKMRTLLHSYNCAKDNATKNASPFPTPFMPEMEEIFGNRTSFAKTHILHMGRGPTQALPVTPMASTSPPPSPVPVTVAVPHPQISRKSFRHVKTARDLYYEGKLRLKKRLAQEKLEEKRRFNNSIIEFLRENESKKLEILKNSLKSKIS